LTNAFLRVCDFESRNAAATLQNRSVNAPALSPRTVIVGIPVNVENWPINRSYLSVMRIAGSGEENSRILQLSHYTEVKVIEVTDRHKIPSTLGWSEPGQLNGLNIPGWFKIMDKNESIVNAIDDLLITYSHHTPDAENFYFMRSELAPSPVDEESLKLYPDNLRLLSLSAEARLTNSKGLFTDPDRPEWIGMSGDDWDDEIAYSPRFAVLRNHRGFPIALFDFESELFERPKNLRLWDGKTFTNQSGLARLVCKESTVKRKNFEIVSSSLVSKIWPAALKKSFS
jgi:hypothetical protein